MLFSGVVFAVPVSLAPYLASKRGWLSSSISWKRSLLAALPLPFLPVALFIGTIDWGDMQEHLTRSLLHALHREASSELAGGMILVAIILFGAVGVASLIWVSVSVLSKCWRAQMLLVLWIGCIALFSIFWAALFGFHATDTAVITTGTLLVFLSGFLFALVVEMNPSPTHLSIAFRFASATFLIALVVGAWLFAAKSVPEKRFPKLAEGPLWTFDTASSGCHRDWGGPTSSEAANEIAFASNDTLGMSFEISSAPLPGSKWEYESCIFSVDAKSGKKIAQATFEGKVAYIRGNADGTLVTHVNDSWTTYSPDLKELGQTSEAANPTAVGTAAHWRQFRSDSSGKLWFDGSGPPKLLGQFPPNGAYIHPLGEERVLVTSGSQFFLFRSDGTQVSSEHFTREGVNFAALSADHRRFAVAVYLWGVGDPSYLEEEKIIVYDAASGKVIAAVPSQPLPQNQSWAALSPDGTLFAVGAQTTLRLFRLPP